MTHFYDPTEPFIIKKNTTLQKSFKYLNRAEGFPVMVVNEDNSLFGVLSSGDISRHLNDLEDVDLSIEIASVCNQTPAIAHESDSVDSINKLLENPKIRSLPLLDNSRKVIKIATSQAPFVRIGNYKITKNSRPYLIAEIGVNHNGSLDEAFFLINHAASSGCNAVKFQHRAENVYDTEAIDEYDLGTQYIISEIERTNLSIEKLNHCCEFASSLGLHIIITPFNETSFNEIVQHIRYFSAIKIASCDLTNTMLIDHIVKSKIDVPLILSTGMSHERDIIKTNSYLRTTKKEYAFLHCNSTYPAPAEDINLSYIGRLAELTDSVVGYSSHDGESCIPISSICYGASIIEFHITRDKCANGTDHRASVEVLSLPSFVRNCNLVYSSIGKSSPRIPSQGELANLQSLGKSLTVNKSLGKGHVLTYNDFMLTSPGSGFSLAKIQDLIGKTLSKDLRSGRLLTNDCIEEYKISSYPDLKDALSRLDKNNYLTGIPVRLHDFEKLWSIFKTNMVEFHMSDRDLSLNPSNYIKKEYSDVFLLIHAVEQYEDGFIFDLASHDEDIIKRSFLEISRLIASAENLKIFFNQSSRIPIVINPGGFTCDCFANLDDSLKKTELIANNLNILSQKYPGYLFLPQTMPPFPWHQGGRSYHNILTSLERIKFFKNICNLKLCLDLSHTALSCDHFKEDIYDHIHIMSDRIAHIHLSDALGSSAEGLEIGAGSIDFKKVHESLNLSSKTFMIPEIWQGHLHDGGKFASSIIRYSSFMPE